MSTTSPPLSTTATTTSTRNQQIKTNLSYLIKGKSSSLKPANLSTRTTLRTIRYISRFVFWRLVRYFKYAFIASSITLLGGTLLGTTIPFIAAIAVPTLPVSIAIGLTTTAIKFSWNHRGNHFRKALNSEGRGDPKVDEKRDAEDEEREERDLDLDRERRKNRGERAWGFN